MSVNHALSFLLLFSVPSVRFSFRPLEHLLVPLSFPLLALSFHLVAVDPLLSLIAANQNAKTLEFVLSPHSFFVQELNVEQLLFEGLHGCPENVDLLLQGGLVLLGNGELVGDVFVGELQGLVLATLLVVHEL